MNVNLEELIVLLRAQNPIKPVDLAKNAATALNDRRFDAPVALARVQDLVQRGLLIKNTTGQVEASRQGWAEAVSAIPFLEQLRADLAMFQYRVAR
jgi:hypothetical protein